ncbi:MAG: acyl-CoA dehydratase activase-related protein [Thermoplasmatota archaeon]
MEKLRVGIDVGSTTAKMAVLDGDGKIRYSDYRRHNADVVETLKDMFRTGREKLGNSGASIAITGSAGIGVSERFDIPFIQEVVAAAEAVRRQYPGVKTLVDVGGEDSKMIFFDDRMRPDIRMNGNCAGGTGAFIDQMATLLNVPIGDLDNMAAESENIYPMASRCGVFAKTDVQNFLARDISKNDIAASVFHAVAVQTLSTLSRGYDPVPKVMFCGGPFTFLPGLRRSFMEAMELGDGDVIEPERAELIPAIGAALAEDFKKFETDLDSFIKVLESGGGEAHYISKRLDPLFSSEEDFSGWERTRMIPVGKTASLKDLDGRDCYIGIDSGSTTTKVVLIDGSGNIAYRYYSNNNGDPIGAVKLGLDGLLRRIEEAGIEVNIRRTAVTGYGEDLIKTAYVIDEGIVETLAHFRAAKEFRENVSFILDIGGQDMKAIYIRNGVINNIEINEACSSGCGSFIETFARTLGHEVSDFARMACSSTGPSDLGTRCTVFMNSKVKQSLREGASIEDISAGLAYSVIKNCLYKVLKIKDTNVLGDNVVVQGGTFRNPAVHRAFEKILGRVVICSDSPELMGAYGAALYAMDDTGATGAVSSTFLGLRNTARAKDYQRTLLRCQGCENNCAITQMKFSTGDIFYTGNKCERIFTNRGKETRKGFNGPEYKMNLLFQRDLEVEGDPLLTIGIPRVLNVYENFPFWATLLKGCRIQIELSPTSTSSVHEKGSKTIMSENICFPAKLTNGHILELIERKIDRIFYPMVVYEEKEYHQALNTFNCPIVSGYPDVIESAISPFNKHGVKFDAPTFNFDDKKLLKDACWAYLKQFGVGRRDFNRSFEMAVSEQRKFKEDLREKTAEVLEKSIENDNLVVLLLSRPYHVDPLINHKIPEMIANLGADVITEDSIPHRGDEHLKDIQVLTQWEYPNRIYNAVKWAREMDNVEVVQLNSFGCGPDAMVCDEARTVLLEVGKDYTLIRIDEVSSPGSVKLRLRSMLESMEQRGFGVRSEPIPRVTTPPFLDKDRKKKIIAPFFSQFHSPLIEGLFSGYGFDVEILPPADRESVNVGLKYTNNEICYPAIVVIGDIIKALQTGEYDLERTVAGITQTGGQCRASSYLSLLKKALVSAGFENIPVVTVSLSNQPLNYQPGAKFNKRKLLQMGVLGILFADSMMQMYNSTAFREVNKGDSQRIVDRYMEEIVEIMRRDQKSQVLPTLERAVEEFNRVEVKDGKFPVVGFVGEIYVKYNPFGNLNLVDWMIDHGIEVVVPPIWDFFAQEYLNHRFKVDRFIDRRDMKWYLSYPMEWYVKRLMGKFEKVREKHRFHRKAHDPKFMSDRAKPIVTLVDQFGEGWLISAEISSFAHDGINNVLCVQPFGCIANHIIGKGVEKKIRDMHPDMNILYLDMDAGSSEVNLLNRLNFLIKSAREDAGLS